MKKIIIAAVFFTSLTAFSQSKKELIKEVSTLKAQVAELEKKYEVDMNDENQKLSYALGANIAENLKSQGLDSLNNEAFLEGMVDTQNGAPKISSQEGMMMIQTTMQKLQQQKAEKAIAVGKEFLDANAKREGVTVLPSGLQYEVITEGTGPKPAPSDQVKVHYHGTLLDGKVFDSSVDRGTPATFGVTQVIQGWVEALQLMPTGSKWKLFIPYDLAYGERGAGGDIGPYSTLIFEVELLEIVK